ncbi:hypothetical protein FRC01_014465, partial [Tulasnella sp. 417]
MASKPSAGRRKRASSVKEVIDKIETDPAHHLAGPFVDDSPTPPSEVEVPTPKGAAKNGHARNGVSRGKRAKTGPPMPKFLYNGLWNDLTSLNWTRVPTSALFLMSIPVLLFLQWQILSPNAQNPFKYLLMIQYPVAGTSDPVMYQKGYG